MFCLVVLERGVQVIFASIIDEKAAHVGLSLCSDDLGDDFEILAKLADSCCKSGINTFHLGKYSLWHSPSTPKRSSSWVHLGLILDTGSTFGSSLVSSEETPIVAPVGEGGEGTVYGSSLLSFARLSNAERYCLLFCTLRLYETISLKLNKTCHLHARTHRTVLEVRAIV